LKAQIVLKGIITLEEWDEMKTHIQFDYVADNYFTELKEIEIRNERMNQVNVMDPYVGKYFSVEYMRRQVLKQTDQEMVEIDKQIEEETEAGIIQSPEELAAMEAGIDPAAVGGAPAQEVAPNQSTIDPADQKRGEF